MSEDLEKKCADLSAENAALKARLAWVDQQLSGARLGQRQAVNDLILALWRHARPGDNVKGTLLDCVRRAEGRLGRRYLDADDAADEQFRQLVVEARALREALKVVEAHIAELPF